MPHSNPLKRQIGPLELWQWATVGAGVGGMILLLSKGKTTKAGVTPEQEEKLLGGLRSAPGVGGGGVESIPPPVNTTPVTPTPGEVGPPGTPGTPGAPGSSAAEVAQELIPTLNSFQDQINRLSAHTSAPPKKAAKKKVAKKKGKPNKAQKKAHAQAKAHKEGKKATAKPRGNHTAQTGKPNHSAAKPLSHRFTPSHKTVQNSQAAQRAAHQHAEVLKRQREQHEREKRAAEKRKREEEAKRKREAEAAQHAAAIQRQRAQAARRRR